MSEPGLSVDQAVAHVPGLWPALLHTVARVALEDAGFLPEDADAARALRRYHPTRERTDDPAASYRRRRYRGQTGVTALVAVLRRAGTPACAEVRRAASARCPDRVGALARLAHDTRYLVAMQEAFVAIWPELPRHARWEVALATRQDAETRASVGAFVSLLGAFVAEATGGDPCAPAIVRLGEAIDNPAPRGDADRIEGAVEELDGLIDRRDEVVADVAEGAAAMGSAILLLLQGLRSTAATRLATRSARLDGRTDAYTFQKAPLEALARRGADRELGPGHFSFTYRNKHRWDQRLRRAELHGLPWPPALVPC